MRTGIGFDSHRLAEARTLVLGGVTIDHPKGLLGHSDGDCVIHAVVDALLGAMGAGDIGEHFPDTDPQWKDADSTRFLAHVAGMLTERALAVSNVDVVVVAAEPSLGPHKAVMAERMASVLGIDADHVNVKAKRPEGFEDAAEDVIAVFAVATVEG
jgi:2-C-methyl-D-erythritol 4-phosphate cytidylyltransferase/2-C-methyl-D-erythritol 2,4-cyclodiphosphate synthase